MINKLKDEMQLALASEDFLEVHQVAVLEHLRRLREEEDEGQGELSGLRAGCAI